MRNFVKGYGAWLICWIICRYLRQRRKNTHYYVRRLYYGTHRGVHLVKVGVAIGHRKFRNKNRRYLWVPFDVSNYY